jgi:hypothetical protein
VPQIPDTFVQSVMPQGQIAPQRIEASPADFGGQVGATLTQASNQEMQQALQRQQLANETAVNDTINNKFFPAFQEQYQKYYALQGKDAVDQLPAYQEQMRDLAQQFRDGIGNQMQQRMFDQESSRRMQVEFAGMGRYAGQQNKVWQAQTSEATVQRLISSAGDKYNDPQMLADAALGTSKQIYKYGIMAGESAEVVHQRQQQAWDKLYSTVVLRQAIDPAMGAQVANQTFQDGVKKGLISGGMQLEIANHLKSRLQLADTSGFVHGLFAGGPSSPVGPGVESAAVGWKPPAGKSIDQVAGDLTTSIATRESGNRADIQNPDPNGLPGRFQFQEGTWQTMSAAYNRAVNKSATGPLDHNDANEQAVAKWQIGQWLGAGYSPAQIASLWNSGHADWSGRVSGEPGKKYDVPGYVSGVMGNYERLSGTSATSPSMVADASGNIVAASQGAGGGDLLQPAQPPPGGWSKEALAAAMPQWEKQIAERYPDNWMAQNQAMSILRSKVSQINQGLTQQTYGDENTIYQAITDLKGHATLTDAMNDPQFAAAWDRFGQSNPKAREGFIEAFARKPDLLYKAMPPTQQQNDRFNELVGEAGLDPYKFVDMPLGNEQLPKPMLDQLHKLQMKFRTGITVEEKKNTAIQEAMKIAATPLASAGIDPKGDANGKAQYKIFYGRLSQWLGEFETNNKRGPKTPELLDGINSLLTQVSVPGAWYGTNSQYGYQLTSAQEQQARIPPTLIPAFSTQFQGKYGRAPLPQELDSVYYATRFHPGNNALQTRIDSRIRKNTELLKQGAAPMAMSEPAGAQSQFTPGWRPEEGEMELGGDILHGVSRGLEALEAIQAKQRERLPAAMEQDFTRAGLPPQR